MIHVRQNRLNVSVTVSIVESSGGVNPGEPRTGLNSSNITSVAYVREKAAAVTISVSALGSPTAAHSDGGFIEIDGTNMPGLYRFDIPDAVVSGDTLVRHATLKFLLTAGSNALAEPLLIDIEGRLVSEFATSAKTEIEDTIWDALPGDHNDTFSMGQALVGDTIANILASPTPTASVFGWSGFTGIDDVLIGSMVVMRSGSLRGATAIITDYVASTKVITIDPPFSQAPAANDDMQVIPATDVLLRKLTELASMPGAAANVASALQLLYQGLRNKIITDSNTSLTKLHKDDGTSMGSSTFSDSGGIFTRGKYT